MNLLLYFIKYNFPLLLTTPELTQCSQC